MSDNLPAVPDPAPSREIARNDVDSWAEVMQPVIWLAERIAGTEFVPKSMRNSAPAVTAAILYGREVGLPPMTSLTQTHVIEGKPSMSAEAMRAMVMSQGHELVFDEATGAICRMRARRHGSDHWTELAWTIDAARQAGIAGKDNWKKYPRAMLIARCTADLCRMVFPDVIHGFRSVEEMEDVGGVEHDAPESPEIPGPRAKVTRKRAAAKKTAPAKSAPPPLEAPKDRPDAPEGPPLPGEDGYEEPAREQASAGGETTEPEGEAGEVEDPPADVDDQAEQPPAEPPSPRKASRAQHRMIFARLQELGVAKDDDEERHLIVSKVAGRGIGSFNDLTVNEAKATIETLARIEDRDALWRLLDEIDAAADAGGES